MLERDLAARVAVLEATEDVRAFIAEYCSLNDRLDNLDEVIDLFTEDAVTVAPSGRYVGRAAIERYYRGFYESSVRFARHYTLNQVIDILDPGSARHRAYFVALHGVSGESRIVFGSYDDRLTKTATGWKIASKVIDVVGATTPEAGWAQGFHELP